MKNSEKTDLWDIDPNGYDPDVLWYNEWHDVGNGWYGVDWAVIGSAALDGSFIIDETIEQWGKGGEDDEEVGIVP